MTDDVLRIKRGSTAPLLLIALTEGGAPADLSSATLVHLTGRKDGTNAISVDLAARPADGVLTYAWQPADTATTGWWRFEVTATKAGKVTKYPTTLVKVDDSLTP